VQRRRERRHKLKLPGWVIKSLSLYLLSFALINIYSQDQTKSYLYVPHVGQAGKDVIWVPTPNELVDKMLEIAGVTEKDFVIDLGSGDGRTVIAAAKLGARALGIEYNPDMVEIARRKAEEAGVSDRTKFIRADLFECDLSEATVVTMFLLPDINLRLRTRLLDLKPGTRIVSNTFTMGDWEPDYEAMTDGSWDSWYTALLWIIPAKIEGIWRIGSGVLTIHQQYQMFYGTLKTDDITSAITEGRVNGEMITFSVIGATYSGRINGGKSMSGTMTSGSGKREWIATRSDH
jgi:SAM-dependent methyltransferase